MSYETEKYEAFESLTAALENLDLYQESPSKEVLDEANQNLSKALEEDPNYFNAKYFQAMTSYFGGYESKAIERFQATLKQATEEKGCKDSFINEVRYNLAAALYENRKEENNLDLAIQEFEKVIAATPTDDLTLRLLARAGVATAYAERSLQVNGTKAQSDRQRARQHCDYVQRELWRDDDFLWRMSFRKRIDKEVAKQIQQIVTEARAKIVESLSKTVPPTTTAQSSRVEVTPKAPATANTTKAESTNQESRQTESGRLESLVVKAEPAEAAPAEPKRVDTEQAETANVEDTREESRGIIQNLLWIIQNVVSIPAKSAQVKSTEELTPEESSPEASTSMEASPGIKSGRSRETVE